MSSNLFRRLLLVLRQEHAESSAGGGVQSGSNHYIYGDWDPLSPDARSTAESGRLMREGRNPAVLP